MLLFRSTVEGVSLLREFMSLPDPGDVRSTPFDRNFRVTMVPSKSKTSRNLLSLLNRSYCCLAKCAAFSISYMPLKRQR